MLFKETLIKGLTPFNSVSLLFLNVQYNKVEFWTFNFAAEIARLVKLTSFEKLSSVVFFKTSLIIPPFLVFSKRRKFSSFVN